MSARRLIALAVTGTVVVVGAAATTGRSGAAFVDDVRSPQAAEADRVQRWVGLEAADQGSCAAPVSVSATGIDASLAVGVGGADAASAVGRTVDCALVLRARDPLPEGAGHVTVALAATGSVLAAAATGLDASAPSASVQLAPGERRAVRLTVRRGDGAAGGTLSVAAAPTAEPSGFLAYSVPVDVCAGALASSCAPAPPTDPGATEPSSTTPAPADPATTTPAAADPSTAAPGDGAGADPAAAVTPPPPPAPAPVMGAGSVQRACVSRRRFTIHFHRLPRGQRYVSAAVRIDGRVATVRRGKTWTAVADLRGRAPKTLRVTIRARTSTGRIVRDVRVYRTCAPPKATGR